MSESLTLEKALEYRAANDKDAEDFFHRYSNMRKYLSEEYYPWIQARCPYFTDHGENHINSVIQAASMLLADHLKPGDETLSSLDIFLILCGILWHDVGNVLGRTGHAEQVVKISEEVKRLGFPSPDIHRQVVAISKAHAGKSGLDIPKSKDYVTTFIRTYDLRPRALAAIVRFADEISENHTRISKALLEGSEIPVENRIYWEFANCISASVPQPSRERVILKIEIQDTTATRRFPCADYPDRTDKPEGITVIEYVLCRLEKMNNERAYCAPEFRGYVTIREIEARLTILHGTEPLTDYDDTFVLLGDAGVRKGDESGYPSIPVYEEFFKNHPNWRPDKLEETLSQ
jgi:HD superfamily phosphodiesterase